MWGVLLYKKIFIPLIISFFTFIYYFNINNNNSTCVSSLSTTYIQNIMPLSNNQLMFTLPKGYDINHIYPFSFISPTGIQLINSLPQRIDVYQPIIKVCLSSPLEEKGVYRIIFTGIENRTNDHINLIGNFYNK